MGLDLPAPDYFILVVDCNNKALPVEAEWIDSHRMDQVPYSGRFRFTRRTNGNHIKPAATIIIKVAINQWIKNGQTNDLVR